MMVMPKNTGNENDDLDINIALEDNELPLMQHRFDYEVDVDNAEVNIDELLKRMDRARDFIEIADKLRSLKDHEMAKLKDIARNSRQKGFR